MIWQNLTKKKTEEKDNKEIDKNNDEVDKSKANKEIDQEELTVQMNKNMSLMMPILSVSISLVAPLGLALYWLVNNIMMIIERLFLNKLLSKEEKQDV